MAKPVFNISSVRLIKLGLIKLDIDINPNDDYMTSNGHRSSTNKQVMSEVQNDGRRHTDGQLSN